MTFPFPTYVFGRLFLKKEKKRISKGGVKKYLGYRFGKHREHPSSHFHFMVDEIT